MGGESSSYRVKHFHKSKSTTITGYFYKAHGEHTSWSHNLSIDWNRVLRKMGAGAWVGLHGNIPDSWGIWLPVTGVKLPPQQFLNNNVTTVLVSNSNGDSVWCSPPDPQYDMCECESRL